jgi:uncharacterized membrane protein YhaH (DUF805 family)
MNYNWFLFSFNGRINCAKYWLVALIILCWMNFVLMVLAAVAPSSALAARLPSTSSAFPRQSSLAATPHPRLRYFRKSLQFR